MDHDKTYHLQRMTPIGHFLYRSGTVRLYKNGDGTGLVWRLWHPFSWILVPVFSLLWILTVGLETAREQPKTQTLADLGLDVDNYFNEHPEKLEWL